MHEWSAERREEVGLGRGVEVRWVVGVGVGQTGTLPALCCGAQERRISRGCGWSSASPVMLGKCQPRNQPGPLSPESGSGAQQDSDMITDGGCDTWYAWISGDSPYPGVSCDRTATPLRRDVEPGRWCATKHKLGVSEVIRGRKREASALPVGVTPVGWWFRVPCGGRCHREFHSKHQTPDSPQQRGPAQQEGSGTEEERRARAPLYSF
ncbi:hypothetical protein EYF80_005199 [Liparis tanakae]|uniref:Uncharacterized protein n=1 Tax=Liparis tanakae TaxID=230148 RepID=A0A4Z2J2Q9_9TELE|nr:hypothetical protein EYF80_005199 [Liparis tanakae]